jgi:uncharacterized protein YcbK (DUF882 family)
VLACGCCALASFASASSAQRNPAPEDWRNALLQDKRELWLVRDDDEMRSIYWTASTGFNRDEYLNLCWFLRDKRNGRVFAMDRNLLDVLCGVQTWLTRNGHPAPIHINSGYRTMATNRAIEGAARNSQHILGKAADIVVPGVSPVKLAGMAALFGRGGTGFYVGRDFVHVDTADERIWIDQRRKG